MAKRILIYTNHFYPEQFKINEIVEWLSHKDVHIRVLTGLPNYPSGRIISGYSNIFKENVIINRLFLIPRGKGSIFVLYVNYITYFISCFFFTIYIAIFKKKYDVIFVHHTSPIFIAIHPIIYSVFRKTKKILWDLDIWPESLKAVDIIKSNFFISVIESTVKMIYSKYDKILVSSDSITKVVKNRFSGDIIYFPNWAEKVIEENNVNINFKSNLNPNKFNIIYTGNIGKAQNFDYLVRTIQLLDENIHWTFVGDGRFKQDFKNIINKKHLTKKVDFIDQVTIDNIPSIINLADSLFLSLKSHHIFSKTVPAKLQTYMALGKPIIAVISGEGAKLIKDSNCGIVEENYDYEKLAKKINNFAKMDKKRLKVLGDNARKYYKRVFSSSIRKEEILNLLYEQ